MSLASEWKKEIEDMSPSRTIIKDKIIEIKGKKKTSRKRRRSYIKKPSLWTDISKSMSNNSYAAYIVVFCLFYLLGWWVIFSSLEQAEHDSKHMAHSSLLHPNGEITHHLPKQIETQISKLAQLQKLHNAKDVVFALKNAKPANDITAKIRANVQV